MRVSFACLSMIFERQSLKDNKSTTGQAKNKKILLIAPLAVLTIVFLAFVYSPVILQEGNPWPEIKAISQLTFGGSDIVRLSGSDNKYFTKSQGGPQTIDLFMKDGGYEFGDQMGSGYFYKSSSKTVVLTRRQYSRFYAIWTVSDFTAETNNDLWKSATRNGITFQYPETLLTEYIHTVDWPPQVQVLNEPFTCTEAGEEIDRAGQTLKRMVDDRTYCVTKESEGAAGSVYTNYTYAFPLYSTGSTQADRKTIIFTFSLQAVQCANYDDPQKTACENERSTFDLDSSVGRMARSIISQ